MILVTGGTGFVGKRLVPVLVAAGRPVRVFSRSAAKAGELGPGVDIVLGDLLDPPSIEAAVVGVDEIVHLAAVHTADGPGAEQITAANVNSTANLVTAAKAAGVRTFVLVSTASVYGMRDGRHHYAEGDTPQPSSAYGRSKLAAETALTERLDGSDVRWVILRPTDIFGRGSPSWERLIDRVRRRRVWLHAGPPSFIQPVSVDDVVRCILAALETKTIRGVAINVAGAVSISYAQLLETIARVSGTRLFQLQIPTLLTRLPARVAGHVAQLAGRTPTFRLARLGWRSDHREVDTSRARDLLGFVATPLAEGLREMIDAIREPAIAAARRTSAR